MRMIERFTVSSLCPGAVTTSTTFVPGSGSILDMTADRLMCVLGVRSERAPRLTAQPESSGRERRARTAALPGHVAASVSAASSRVAS